MKKFDIEIVVGLFICIGIGLMAYTSINLGQVEFLNNNYYPVRAAFTSVTGLKPDTNVEIAGVKVGKVESIHLDDFEAIVTILIKKDIKIQDDAIASINTNGILGEKYIRITPGGSDETLGPGDMIVDTEPPFDLLSVIKDLVVDE